MSQIDDKLEQFTNAITSEANAESRAILEEISREWENTLSGAEDEALNDAYRYIRDEVARIRTESGRRVSRKTMECKRALFARREEHARKVLDDVLQNIRAYEETDAYVDQLASAMNRALDLFSGCEAVVSLRAEDMKLVPALRAAAGRRPVAFEQGRFHLGGLIVECKEKQRQINETFDANLDEWKTRFFAEMGAPSGQTGMEPVSVSAPKA